MLPDVFHLCGHGVILDLLFFSELSLLDGVLLGFPLSSVELLFFLAD